MKQAGRLLLPDNRRSLLYGFHRSDLVIHMHHGDQDRVRPQRLPEFLQINHAPAIHPEPGNLESLLLQIAHGILHRRVLDGCGNQMSATAPVCHGTAHQRQIVCLRAAGGKENFLLLRLQRRGDLFPGIPNILLRCHPTAVKGRGISEILPQNLHHQIRRCRRTAGGGGIVKICFHFSYRFPFLLRRHLPSLLSHSNFCSHIHDIRASGVISASRRPA